MAHTKAAGFLDKPRPDAPHIHMLIVTEIAEATEAWRDGEPPFSVRDGKPEGEATELADALVRILEHFAFHGWDAEKVVTEKMKYNVSRGYRHEGKRS